MPYLTLTENLKLQLSPGLVASYDIQPGNRVGLFWDKHTHTHTRVYLLTYLPWTQNTAHNIIGYWTTSLHGHNIIDIRQDSLQIIVSYVQPRQIIILLTSYLTQTLKKLVA